MDELAFPSVTAALAMVRVRKQQRMRAGQELQRLDAEAARQETLYREAIVREQVAFEDLDAALEREAR